MTHGAHSIGAASSPRGMPMSAGAGRQSTSSTPTTRSNCEQPVVGDDRTREQAGCEQRAQLPMAVMPSKRMQYQQGVGSLR